MITPGDLPLASESDLGLGVIGDSLAIFEVGATPFDFAPNDAFVVIAADR